METQPERANHSLRAHMPPPALPPKDMDQTPPEFYQHVRRGAEQEAQQEGALLPLDSTARRGRPAPRRRRLLGGDAQRGAFLLQRLGDRERELQALRGVRRGSQLVW
jgi:hypothetical protein